MTLLLDRASNLVESDDDRLALTRAAALDGLHLDLLEPDQGRRIAIAVRTAADLLRVELRDGPEDRDVEFAVALGDLSMWLTEPAEGTR